MKNGNSIVKLEDDECIDNYGKANLKDAMPSHLGSYDLSYNKRLMNDVIEQIDGFYKIGIHYTDTDSLYTQKTLVWLGW